MNTVGEGTVRGGDPFRPYLPEHLVPRLLAGDFPPPGVPERIWTVTLFSDVSGFTPLSEALTRLGKEGSERLSLTLRNHFERMISILREHRGSVIKFGGDAAAVLFPEEPGVPRSEIVRRALRCAHRMQAAIADHSEVVVPELGETFRLRMKIGIAGGEISQLLVGDRLRLEYVAAGRACDRMAEAEHHAEAGEVVAAPEVVDLSDQPDLWKAGPVGFAKLVREPLLPGDPTERPEPEQLPIDVGRRFVHPMIAEQLLATGGSPLQGEHRKCTTMFVQFRGVDYDRDPAAFGKLQEYFLLVSGILRRYGGHLNQLATGDKGSVLHVIFGAPASYENDEERAVRAAIEIRDARPPFVGEQRIGVNTGSVFGGDIGSPLRREYTALGDATNLAARLMGNAAPNRILCSGSTRERAGEAVDWLALDPIRVKGKTAPVEVWQPIGAHRFSRQELAVRALVGREAEVGLLEEELHHALAGGGRWIHLEGEAGVGKTRLVEEFVGRRPAGVPVAWARIVSWESSRELSAWEEILTTLLSIPADARPDIRKKLVEKRIGDAADEVGRVFGWWDAPAADGIPDSVRLQRLEAACDRAVLPPGEPGLVVFDDVQWLDPGSRTLFEHLCGLLPERPVLFLTIGRPGGKSPAMHSEPSTSLRLAPLDRAEIAAVIGQVTPGGRPDEDVVDVAVEGSRGNPMFALELIRHLDASGALLVDAETRRCYLRPGTRRELLPDGINGLLLARIDGLPEIQRQVLRAASVVGGSFDEPAIARILARQSDGAGIAPALERLAGAELLAREGDGWRFATQAVHEVAYESVSYERRRELHRAIAEELEARPDAAESASELASHWDSARDDRKALHWHGVAWRRAVDAYRNQEGLRHLERAEFLLRRLACDPVLVEQVLDERARVRNRLGDHAGAFLDQRSRFESAFRRRNAATMSDSGFRMSGAAETLGRYRQSLRLARRSGRTAWAAGLTDMAFRSDLQVAIAYWRSGNLSDARDLLDELLESGVFAERPDELAARVRLARGIVLTDLGALDLARVSLEEAVNLARQSGSRSAELNALVSLGAAHFRAESFVEAERVFAVAGEKCREIGDRRRQVSVTLNLGSVALAIGDLRTARERCVEASYQARRLGLRPEEATAKMNLGIVASQSKRPSGALELYRHALALFERIGSGEALLARANICEVLIAEKDDSARAELELLSAEARRRGDIPMIAWSLEELSKLLAGAGRLEEAAELSSEVARLRSRTPDARATPADPPPSPKADP